MITRREIIRRSTTQSSERNLTLFQKMAQKSVGQDWVVTPSGVRVKNGGLTGVSSCVAVNPAQQSGGGILLNMKNVDATGAAVSIMNAIASKP
jgi:hypothetical protein